MDTSEQILMVEGQSDFYFVEALCERSEQSRFLKDIKVDTPSRGEKNLIGSFINESKNLQRTTVGAVLDADANSGDKRESITSQLIQNGYVVSETPCRDGWISDANGDLPRVGVWMMPDNRRNGELEDLVLDMIPQKDVVLPMAENHIESVPFGSERFDKRKRNKALVHAWLTSLKKPGQFGRAVESNLLDLKAPLVDSFVNWMVRLYGNDGAVRS